ncbi:uncharacterized protein LOC121789788 [Salvia splendens]|uniref:uncharacterized protein LOC121789788 n=1 Tax=Salvia splendens TaxID=180675 RepID=UPI001C26C71C|nr:uncharacterized protein LOC121789788 [Salvia splendens]
MSEWRYLSTIASIFTPAASSVSPSSSVRPQQLRSATATIPPSHRRHRCRRQLKHTAVAAVFRCTRRRCTESSASARRGNDAVVDFCYKLRSLLCSPLAGKVPLYRRCRETRRCCCLAGKTRRRCCPSVSLCLSVAPIYPETAPTPPLPTRFVKDHGEGKSHHGGGISLKKSLFNI